MACPSCCREIPMGDIRPDGFQCPWCKAHLKRGFRGGRVAHTAILLLGFWCCYEAGARGVDAFLGGVVVYFFVGGLYYLLTSIYWPKVEKDPLAQDGFPHIVPPPDGPKKP
jgi:hypothetical protein